MKKVYMPEYQGEVFKTDQGTLLLFMCDAERWVGLWPGMSWDTFYDKYYPQYTSLPSYRFKAPVIWIGPYVNYCRRAVIGGQNGEYGWLVRNKRYEEADRLVLKPQCDKVTKYRHCSFECWYALEKQLLLGTPVFLQFEAVFKPFKNRWMPFRQKWLNGS